MSSRKALTIVGHKTPAIKISKAWAVVVQFDKQFSSDEEECTKKGKRLIETYNKATDTEKALIDDIFITLCGWSLHTLATENLSG